MRHHIRGVLLRIVAIIAALGMSGALTACGSSDTRTQLSVWSWEPSMDTLIEQFEALNPDIHVTRVGTAQYEDLNKAIQNGYGTPDVVQLEYYALPQYAVSGQLCDLTEKTQGYDSFYTPGSFSSVQLDDHVYAVPMDSGPMAWFYNDDVFRQAGVDASTIHTWDDYYKAAVKLKAMGVYITADAGDASFYNAMIWLAGGRPYHTSHDGKEVSITLDTDQGTQEFTEFWQRMIDEGLVNTRLTTWSDDWKRALGDGRIASVFAGAWMPSMLLSDNPGGAGLWRVTTMPTLHGEVTNAENGGSALGILRSSRKPEAAYRFIEYVCHNRDGIQTRVDAGAFPADNETLNSAEFLARTTVTDSRGLEIPYFGSQHFNQVLARAASQVSTGYQYLPFEVYARNDFQSTVGQAYAWVNQEHDYEAAKQRYDNGLITRDQLPEEPTPEITLRDGITLWQSNLKEYGTNQGFTVK